MRCIHNQEPKERPHRSVAKNNEQKITYPSAKAPDHWSKKPRTADMRIAIVLLKFQLKVRTPGGSNQGINVTRKNKVIGVVFHINLFDA